MSTRSALQQHKSEENKNGSNRARERSMLEKVAQLEQRVVLLERERSSQLYSRRHEFRKVFCALEEADVKLNQQRKVEKKELSQQISRIRGNVRGFQKMLADMKPGPAFMEKLRQVLEETETFILAFKDRQREAYESLLVEERQASQEVMAFHRKMEAWPSGVTVASGHTTTATAAATDGGSRGRGGEGGGEGSPAMPPAVLAFERFLQQTGGAGGGWDEYDHNTFLHIRSKYPGEKGFTEAALHELPTHTESEIKAHGAWYTEYCTLLEAKRLAIQQWRKNRQLVHSQQLKAAADKEAGDDGKKKQIAAKLQMQEKERQQDKEKLHAWKVRQELKRREAEEQRLRVDEEKAKKREKEKMRQAELRLQVGRYHESREREKQVAAEVEQVRLVEEKQKQIMATREIEKFRERDMKSVAEKKERVREKEMAKIEQNKRLDKLKEQVAVIVARDPDRLFRPTAGWKERKKARTEECQWGAAIGVSSRGLPRRAVPAWRQGL